MRHFESRPSFQDKTLVCCDCNQPFTFTAGEQLYYFERGLIQTRRCPDCRERRRLTLSRDSDWGHVRSEARREIERNG